MSRCGVCAKAVAVLSTPEGRRPRCARCHALITAVHGFRTERSVTAYCGAIVRPEPDRPRLVSRLGSLPFDACPECVAVYVQVAASDRLNDSQ